MPAPRDGRETWERHAGAACAPLVGYRRREPEKTLLHQVVSERLETFLEAARDRSAHSRELPAFVEHELRAYLDCGILAHGFARIRCPGCGFERLGRALPRHMRPAPSFGRLAAQCRGDAEAAAAVEELREATEGLAQVLFRAVPDHAGRTRRVDLGRRRRETHARAPISPCR